MQISYRYLVKQRTTVVANMAGFVTEYRPVYTHQLKLTKGIDNDIEFRVLNADQKPIDLADYTTYFVAYDEDNIKVLEIESTNSSTITGLTTTTITEEDLVNIPQQYLSYVLYIVDVTDKRILTYSDRGSENKGTIFLDGEAFPRPRADVDIIFNDTSSQILPETNNLYEPTQWVTNSVSGKHSVYDFTSKDYTDVNIIKVSPTGFDDTISIQYSTDGNLTNSSKWHTIDDSDLTTSTVGTETHFEFNGAFNFLRVVSTTNPELITYIKLEN